MSFDELYKTFWPRVFRLCMGYVNDSDWAKDIAQETFVSVWQQLPKFRNESSVGTWVFRIASNHCLRQMEKKKQMPGEPISMELEDTGPASTESKMEFLYQCISELPEVDRIIISLELEDVDQAEIASIMGISAGNVRVRIHRIKEKLTEKVENYER